MGAPRSGDTHTEYSICGMPTTVGLLARARLRGERCNGTRQKPLHAHAALAPASSIMSLAPGFPCEQVGRCCSGKVCAAARSRTRCADGLHAQTVGAALSAPAGAH